MMKKSLLLASAGVLLCTVAGMAAERPNIVVIYSDDQGLGDVGVYGCPDIPTPHMDSIAEDPFQKKGVAARHPETVSNLRAEWERWSRTAVPTPWGWKE